MAKIKTKKYTIDGEEIKVDFSCSSSGVFSFSMRGDIMTKLGFSYIKDSSLSLSELENHIDEYVKKYLEATKKMELVIAIQFFCGGEFAKRQDRKESFLPDRSKFRDNGYMGKESKIGFNYEILIKESYNNQIIYHNTCELEELYRIYNGRNPYKGDIQIDGYASTNIKNNHSDYTFIPFTKEALANVESIQEQLRKASQFIYELVSSKDIEILLGSKFNNQLTE